MIFLQKAIKFKNEKIFDSRSELVFPFLTNKTNQTNTTNSMSFGILPSASNLKPPSPFSIHLYCHIGADDGAESAARAGMGLIKAGDADPPVIFLFCQPNVALRTDPDAEPAPLASLFVNDDPALGRHRSFPPVFPPWMVSIPFLMASSLIGMR
jgi:hypothetical protein